MERVKTLEEEKAEIRKTKCLGGSVEACDDIAGIIIGKNSWNIKRVNHYDLERAGLNCRDYMKVIRKGCSLGSGRCCVLLGNEFHSISVNRYGSWEPKYGANCSLRNQDEAFKYYKKACDLGEGYGCSQYTELQNDIDEINRHERDKTQKSDITIRRK